MSEIKISQLPGASSLTGTETVPVVQNGATKRTTIQDIANLADPYDFTPENVANKSNDVEGDAESTVKYPSVKAIKDYTDGLVVGALTDQGDWDASTNAFPTVRTAPGTVGDPIQKGDLWYISVGGTLGGNPVLPGYSIRALVNNPSTTVTNWGFLNVGFGFTPENVANKSSDSTFTGANNTKYPTQLAVKTYVDNAASSGSTLQTVTAGIKRNLTNGLNFQGTDSGPSNTSGKNDINAFGSDAANGYTGAGPLNAFGNSAAQNSSGVNVNALGGNAAEGNTNTGNNVNALGPSAALSNSGENVNALGSNAASSNSGNNVNAIGAGAGTSNTHSHVNLIGLNAAADGPNQTVFTKNGSTQIRFDYNSVPANVKYTLPTTSGRLALFSEISTPTLQAVTTVGAVTTTNITSENASGNKIEAKSNANSSSAYLTQDNSRGSLVFKSSTGATTTIQPNTTGTSSLDLNLPNTTGTKTLAITSQLTLQEITSGSNKNLASGNNYQGTGAGDSIPGSPSNKIHFGANAGKLNGGNDNITLGQNSGAYTATGASVAYGANNVAIGPNSLTNDSISGSFNVGASNVAIGSNAGKNTSGSTVDGHVFIGNEAGLNDKALDSNICIGYNAGKLSSNPASSGGNNIKIGKNAGLVTSGTPGNTNVFIGSSAGNNATCNRAVLIGTNLPVALGAGGNGAVCLNGGSITGASQFSVGNGDSTSSKAFRIDFNGVSAGTQRELTIPTENGTLLVASQTTSTSRVELTNTQVAALNTTSIEITPAVGSGKTAILKSLTFRAATGTLWSNTSINVTYNGTSTAISYGTFSNILNNRFSYIPMPQFGYTNTPPADGERVRITATGAPTGGTAGFVVTAEYITITN
jgi:hypothetical protein